MPEPIIKDVPPGWQRLLKNELPTVMAALFFWLYFTEKEAHADTAKKWIEDSKQFALSKDRIIVELSAYNLSPTLRHGRFVADSLKQWKAAQYDSIQSSKNNGEQ